MTLLDADRPASLGRALAALAGITRAQAPASLPPLAAAARVFEFEGISISLGDDGSVRATDPSGVVAWNVSAAQFAGSPVLSVIPRGILASALVSVDAPEPAVPGIGSAPAIVHRHGSLTVQLSGARWPGTDLVADFLIELARDITITSDGEQVDESLAVSGPFGFSFARIPTDLLAPLSGTIAPPAGRISALGAAEIAFAGDTTARQFTFLPGRMILQGATPNATTCAIQGLEIPLFEMTYAGRLAMFAIRVSYPGGHSVCPARSARRSSAITATV
jgi:hypothetical protein